MAKDPAFLFYSQDWIVGTLTMDFEERGKFITILSQMHQQGRMKEETIRFLVGSVSDNLKAKFSIDKNGLWYNKRLEEESEKRANFTKTRRENGLKGGRPKKEKPIGKPKENLKVNHMGNHMGNENENKNEDIIKDVFSFKKSLIDLDVQEPHLSDWLKVRKNKKASNTQTALNGFLNQVKKTNLTADQVVKICAEKSWSGFNSDYLDNGNSFQSSQPNKPTFVKNR